MLNNSYSIKYLITVDPSVHCIIYSVVLYLYSRMHAYVQQTSRLQYATVVPFSSNCDEGRLPYSNK